MDETLVITDFTAQDNALVVCSHTQTDHTRRHCTYRRIARPSDITHNVQQTVEIDPLLTIVLAAGLIAYIWLFADTIPTMTGISQLLAVIGGFIAVFAAWHYHQSRVYDRTTGLFCEFTAVDLDNFTTRNFRAYPPCSERLVKFLQEEWVPAAIPKETRDSYRAAISLATTNIQRCNLRPRGR